MSSWKHSRLAWAIAILLAGCIGGPELEYPTLGVWYTQSNMKELDSLNIASIQKPLVIFKHSPTCAISTKALYELEQQPEAFFEEATWLIVNVLEEQRFSYAIADRYGVRHESPQILIIEEGRCRQHIDLADVKAQNIRHALIP